MIWLIALAAMAMGFKVFDQTNSLYKTGGSYLPEALRIDWREKSFAAQDQTTVRLPHGGNPDYQKHVADITMIDTPQYQQDYQINIRNLQILTEDYRIDDQFMTDKNNYSNYHMDGDSTFSKIDSYWHKRRAERC